MTDALERPKTALADRYTTERELGQGGMAVVCLAHDARHDRRVAVKVLRPELPAILGGERFLREIKTTAQLTHPTILPLLDSGEAEGFFFLSARAARNESPRAAEDCTGASPSVRSSLWTGSTRWTRPTRPTFGT